MAFLMLQNPLPPLNELDSLQFPQHTKLSFGNRHITPPGLAFLSEPLAPCLERLLHKGVTPQDHALTKRPHSTPQKLATR